VCDNTRKLVVRIEDHAIRTRRPTSVHRAAAQDRELVVCPRDREHEALVVVVDVRVGGDRAASRVELVARCLCGADRAAGVADCAAGRGTGACFDIEGGCESAGDEDGR
jgi:hypothetical protein